MGWYPATASGIGGTADMADRSGRSQFDPEQTSVCRTTMLAKEYYLKVTSCSMHL